MQEATLTKESCDTCCALLHLRQVTQGLIEQGVDQMEPRSTLHKPGRLLPKLWSSTHDMFFSEIFAGTQPLRGWFFWKKVRNIQLANVR